jgi:hypothetical protein
MFIIILSSVVLGLLSGLQATVTGFIVQQKSLCSTVGVNIEACCNGINIYKIYNK